jgi:hypothetical protein
VQLLCGVSSQHEKVWPSQSNQGFHTTDSKPLLYKSKLVETELRLRVIAFQTAGVTIESVTCYARVFKNNFFVAYITEVLIILPPKERTPASKSGSEPISRLSQTKFVRGGPNSK